MFHFSSHIQEQQDSQFKRKSDLGHVFGEVDFLSLVQGVFWFSF